MRTNEIQIPLEKSKIKLKNLDDFRTEQELKAYLETLELLELLKIYYIQSYEISRMRDVILDSIK